MYKIYIILQFISLFCFPFCSQAQLHVKGIIKDDKGASIPFASILLLSSSDSSLVQGQVSNGDGLFSIAVKEADSYFISVSAIGFYDVTTPILKIDRENPNIDIGNLVMGEKVEELNEVVVKADRPMFEQKTQFESPEDLIGRKCPFLTNLETREIRGLESQGMILAASTADGLFALLEPHVDLPAGTRIS